MAVVRKRLIFWLIKAYIKKSGKTILLSFVVGLIAFFGFLFISKYYSQLFPFIEKKKVGVVGAYTQNTLPPEVVGNLSYGLTVINKDGSVSPGLAESWETMDNGKTYKFNLKKNQYFSDGREVTSDTINYDFADVAIEKPDKYTITFKLKDAYAPFLVTVSQPIFNKNNAGAGEYRIDDVELNGNFVQSLTIANVKNTQNTIHYEFYPTEEAVKMAFLLGEVSEIRGVTDNKYKDVVFTEFPNTEVVETANYNRLVTLFFNTSDPVLSQERLRLSLSYAIPNEFKEGKRTYLPYSTESTFFNEEVEARTQDFNHAQLLLLPEEDASESAKIEPPKEITIKTLARYRPAAESIAASWKQLNINTKIEEVSEVPNDFQVFVGDFRIPKDPDQYTLWHSDQQNNITNYRNLRIDKLLEDGRKTSDYNARRELYRDFQRYLMEDAPAAFLYFPTEYTIARK